MEFARSYNMLCTIFLEFSIYIRYDIRLKWCKSVGKYTRFDTLSNIGLWKYMVFEMCCCIIAPYPFLVGVTYKEYVEAYDYTISYEFNDIMLFIMFCRMYLPVRFSFYMTEFLDPRT